MEKGMQATTRGPVHIMYENQCLRNKHYPEFKKIFGANLFSYVDLRTGFDIVRFDEEYLKVPAGQSTREFILLNYNQRAADLVRELIGGTA